MMGRIGEPDPAEERMDLAHSRRGRPHLLRHSVTSSTGPSIAEFSASRTGPRVEPVFTITIRTTAPAMQRASAWTVQPLRNV